MIFKSEALLAAGALILATSTPTFAQSATASAGDPDGLVKLLQVAGYKPELARDDYGDPQIELEISGYNATLFFYGCDETAHTGCTSLQLRAGFDRKTSWTDKDALALAKKYRFASVWLDDDGDPWVQWDIVTGSGIPAKVFMDSVELFGDTVTDVADAVFADE